MKISQNFILREIAGEHILIPVGETALQIHGMITLSESGLLLYQMLQEERCESELVDALLAEYAVERDVAEADVRSFLAQMRQTGILSEG